MRVALVIYGSLDLLSGGFLYDRKLVEHLRSQGDRVSVFALPWRPYPALLLDNSTSSLVEKLEREAPDLVLQDELCHPSLFRLNRRLRSRLDRPVVSIVHHLRWTEPRPRVFQMAYRKVERAYLEAIDAFVFNSETTRQAASRTLGRMAKGVVAYPAGNRLGPPLDPSAIQARVREDRPLRLAFVGNVIPRKGLRDLLVALGRLRGEPWELLVAGSLKADPRHAARMIRLTRSLGVDRRVRWLGALGKDELRKLLARSDLTAMPFSYEGFGIVYVEGMAFGLPALASTEGGAGEVVEDGKNGRLFRPGDVDGLADFLGGLVEDRGRLLEPSLEARRRFDHFPTWEESGAKARQFLETLAHSS